MAGPLPLLKQSESGGDVGASRLLQPTLNLAIERDVAYGRGPSEQFDVYRPRMHGESRYPKRGILFMVHGGAWRVGDKQHQKVVENKVMHWVEQGWVFVSINYPMLPDVDPLRQAEYVARALARVQVLAPHWGSDPGRVVLMGHSAGAHLVSLINAAPRLAHAQGAGTWLGVVALDSAALDVTAIMSARHLALYDLAFGRNTAYWEQVSPLARLQGDARPALLVCSTRRADSCSQAHTLATAMQQRGLQSETLPLDLSHSDINAQLGLPGRYTEQVDRFLNSLNPLRN